MEIAGRGRAALAAAAALVALALSLSACGGGSDSGTFAVESTQADTTGAETTEAQAGERQKPGKDEDSAPRNDEGEAPDSQAPDSAESPAGGEGQANGSDGAQSGSGADSDSGGKAGGKGSAGASPGRLPQNPQEVEDFGAEAGSADMEAALAALDSYLTSFKQEDWRAGCALMSRAVVETLKQLASGNPQLKGAGDCAAILAALAKMGAKPDLGVTPDSLDELRIEGNAAFAFYSNRTLVMAMTREGSAWKVNGVQPERVS